jgi:hypothetical protein
MCQDAGCTHFMSMDCDEYYDRLEFALAMETAEQYDGTACELYTYFKSPTLRLEKIEDYSVPLIHKIDNQTHGSRYPVYCDPTRGLKTSNFYMFKREEIMMHHFSWVRTDIHQKVRNSSAKKNLDKSSWLQDYENAKEGSYVSLYDCQLIAVPNRFEIQDFKSSRPEAD